MVKKLRFSILSLLMLICGAVMAQEVTPYKSLSFPDDNKANNKIGVYDKTWTAKIGTDSWSISNFSNFNWGWGNIRCGRKKDASVATIVNDAAFEKAVTKVVVNLSVTNGYAAKVNSIKLIVASDDQFSKDVQTIAGDVSKLPTTAADVEFAIESPAENLFYKLEVNCQKTGNSNGIVQINSLKYYAAEGGSGTVSAPKFSEASTTFTDPFQVTLTAEEGADIYYTTNGDDPTTSSTKYTAPIDITTTTTLKAIAVKDGKTSSVATATYTLDTPLASFEEIKANGQSGEKYRLTFNDAVVTYVNGRYVYTEDATGGLLLYLNSGHGLETGQKLHGTCEVTYTVYNGIAELTAIDKSALTITSDAVIPTTTVTIADLLDNMQKYQSMHVKVVNAKVTSAFSSRMATVEQEGSSIQVYQKASFTMSEFVKGATVNLEGFPGYNSSTKQIHVWSADNIEVAGNVKAPTLSENTQKFTSPLAVTITAAEGAAIYYTLDGTDPKTSDTKKTYNAGEAITITATTTLRAVAEKDNIFSDETTATYTFVVEAPTFDVASKKFSEPFEVTITAHEGASIYYTLNGEDPTQESTPYGGAIAIPAETTTLKAIAVINGVLSDVTTATYTYRASSDNDGSFAKPYTAEEVLENASDLTGKTVWVKGVVLGQGNDSGDGYKPATSKSNIAIGESGKDKCIVIALKSGVAKDYCNNLGAKLLGRELMFYGTIKDYFGRAGMGSGSIAFAGTEESPIAPLSVKTQEGYATFVSEFPFFVPEGVECATVTEADDNGVLNFDYKYKASSETYDIVPANYPVLVKADGKKTFNLAIASTRKGSSAGTNLLKAGTGSEIAAEDGHYYYKLAYDNFDTKEGLGFYWGATDGGAFTVPAGSAYLDIESASNTVLKSFRFDNATTGISTPVVNGQSEAVKVAYTLDGRRVDAAHLTRGLYIVNGKKVIVK